MKNRVTNERRTSCSSAVGRACRLAVGAIFFLSAGLKALSLTMFAFQISYFGIVRTPWFVEGVAYAVIAFETVLGMALIWGVGLRRWSLATAFGATVLFTLLIVYGWVFKNLQDCGCFGKYLKMTPGISILKNIALIALIWGAWRGEKLRDTRRAANRAGKTVVQRGVIAGIAAAMVVLAVVTGIADKAALPELEQKGNATDPKIAQAGAPQATDSGIGFSGFVFDADGKRYDLSKGVYLVAMMSDSCEGCAEIVRTLNEAIQNPDLPPIVSFILGEEATLEKFRASYSPQFPTQLLAPLRFLQYVGDAPPRFILVRDGKQLKYWDKKVPPEIDIVQTMLETEVESEKH